MLNVVMRRIMSGMCTASVFMLVYAVCTRQECFYVHMSLRCSALKHLQIRVHHCVSCTQIIHDLTVAHVGLIGTAQDAYFFPNAS
jgi:hypothetical protein